MSRRRGDAEVLPSSRATGPCASARTPRPTATRSGRCSASGVSLARDRPRRRALPGRRRPVPARARVPAARARSSAACPPMLAQRTLIALDCGSARRIDRAARSPGSSRASSTSTTTTTTRSSATSTSSTPRPPAPPRSSPGCSTRRASRWPRAPPLALYVGLVTDTGRFQYANTTPRAHELAARLLEEGVAARRRVLDALRVAAARARSGCSAWRSGARRSRAADASRVTWLARDDFDVTRRRRRRPRTASSTRCARSRASSWRRSCASRATAAAPRARSRCARAPAASTARRSRASGAAAGIPAPPGFSTDESVEEIVAFLERAVGA